MKRTDTIALYKEAFLEGKDQSIREKFENKSLEKQYASIMAWKRRQGEHAVGAPSATAVLDLLRKAKKTLVTLPDLTEKETQKLNALCQELTETAKNFDLIKKERLLRTLRERHESLGRQIAELEEEGVK